MTHLGGSGRHVCAGMSLSPVFLPLIHSALEPKTLQSDIHYFTWIIFFKLKHIF